MKKILLSLILLVFEFTPLIAGGIDIQLELTQTPYKWGGKNGNRFEYIFGETNDEYIALRSLVGLFGFYSYKIGRYDKETMNLVEVKPLFPNQYINSGSFTPSVMWGVRQFRDKFYMLFGTKDIWNNKIRVYHQNLDSLGNIAGSEDKLLDVEFGNGSIGAFDGVFSYDSSKFLSVYEIPTKNKENQQYSFHVYNIEDMSVVFERNIEIPIMDKNVNLIRYDVDNDGNVFGLVKIFEKREKGTNPTDNYTYRIYEFQAQNEQIIQYDFDIDRYINSITFKVQNGIIYCSGFWGKKSVNNISGVYSLRLDAKTGEELVQDVYEFSDSFVEEFYTEKQVDRAERRNKELEVPTIVYDHFIIQKDGSAIIIGEQYYSYTICTGTMQSGYSCTTYYVYNDILVSSIGNDGRIIWSIKIPKNSRSTSKPGILSYSVHQKGDDLYFIYYDHKDNFSLDNPKKYKSVMGGKNLDLVCTKINVDGEKEKKLLYNYGDKNWNKLLLHPFYFKTLNSSEVIGQGFVKGHKEVLCRFTIR